MEQKTHWKDIEGYAGKYQVSTAGNVRSNYGRKLGANLAFSNRCGYLRVGLSIKGNGSNHTVHRLVAEAFIPNPENKDFVNHINGIKTDNRVENLEWCTRCENNQHAVRAGLNTHRGIKNSKCVLSEDEVRHIRSLFAEGVRVCEVMKIYPQVQQGALSKIKANINWQHLI